MNLKDGYIQTVSGNNKNTVLKKLPDPASTSLDVTWVASGGFPSYLIPYGLEFTNLMRWRVPEVQIDGNDVPYHISIIDNAPNAQGKNLSDYFTVGKIIKCTAAPVGYKMKEAEALMLKSDVVLVAGESYPYGSIQITWAEYPNVEYLHALGGGGGDILARPDRLGLGFRSSVPIDYNVKSFHDTIEALPLTDHAYWPEVAHNMPFKLEVTDPDYENYIKVINREGDKVYFKLSDNEDFYNYVVAHGEEEVSKKAYLINVGMRATFPNGVYPDEDFEFKIYIKKK